MIHTAINLPTALTIVWCSWCIMACWCCNLSLCLKSEEDNVFSSHVFLLSTFKANTVASKVNRFSYCIFENYSLHINIRRTCSRIWKIGNCARKVAFWGQDTLLFKKKVLVNEPRKVLYTLYYLHHNKTNIYFASLVTGGLGGLFPSRSVSRVFINSVSVWEY